MELGYLKSILHYDPGTGMWTRFFKKHNREDIGSLDTNGHRQIWVDDKLYQSARLAWFYMKGEWPSREVDHEDRNPSNDKWSNLRLATRSQNCCNREVFKNNKLGIKGISYRRNRYMVRITKNKKTYYLGSFQNLEEAIEVYQEAAEKLHDGFAQ